MSTPYGPVTAVPTEPKPRRRVFRWTFLAVQLLFAVWLITGFVRISEGSGGRVGDALSAYYAGGAIGAVLLIALWAAVDVVLWLIYARFARRRRPHAQRAMRP